MGWAPTLSMLDLRSVCMSKTTSSMMEASATQSTRHAQYSGMVAWPVQCRVLHQRPAWAGRLVVRQPLLCLCALVAPCAFGCRTLAVTLRARWQQMAVSNLRYMELLPLYFGSRPWSASTRRSCSTA